MPALDAVIFMTPRNSHVDVVQAVGRVMRKAAGKAFGYIILPVAIPENSDPAAALDDNKDFAKVWSVLRALRSHDDRLNAEINSIDLNQRLPQRIIFGGAASPTTDVLAPGISPWNPYSRESWSSAGIEDTGTSGQKMSPIFSPDSSHALKTYYRIRKTRHCRNGSMPSIQN